MQGIKLCAWIKSMSIKNQSRLPIFASLIIGVTVCALFGLNFLVDKISTTTPPRMALQTPAQARPGQPSLPGLDDALPPGGVKDPSGSDDSGPKDFTKGGGAKARPNGGGAPSTPGPIRRVNGGKGDARMEQRGPMPQGPPPGYPPQGFPPGYPGPRGYPQGPPGGGGGYYPPPFPEGFNPYNPPSREEMERHMQMYPPPMDMMYPPNYGPPMERDDYYDSAPYFEPEDYYDYDFNSKNEIKKDTNFAAGKNQPQLTELKLEDEQYQADMDNNSDEELGADEFLEDEYLMEYLEENP